MSDTDSFAERVRMAERISDWLDHFDLGDDAARTALATGLASVFAAVAEARRLTDRMLALDPLADAAQADQALEILTELTAQLGGELRWQLDELDRGWEALEDRLIELSPDE